MAGGAVAPTVQAPWLLQSWPGWPAPPSSMAMCSGWSCMWDMPAMSPMSWHWGASGATAATVTAAASSSTQQLRMADAKPCKGSVTASSQSSERARKRKKARFMA